MSLRILRVLLVVVASSRVAAADDKSTCVASYSSAQDLRIAGNLVDAQRELRVCAGTACPAFIARECTQWLEEVESSMPTVVVSATDGEGHDVTEVTVTVDGGVLLERLDGRALPMNPGPHALVYRHADMTVTEQILVRMGEKNRPLEVVFLTPKPPEARIEAVPVTPPRVMPPIRSPRTLQTLGFVTIGVGAAAVLAGGIFGITAIATESAHCMNELCDPGTVATLQTETTLSTVGLIVGAVLVATGVTLAIVGKPKRSRAMTVLPMTWGHGVDFRW
jgi:hypothetical protein